MNFSFYDPNNVGTLFLTRNDLVAKEASNLALQEGVQPAWNDDPGERTILILVDAQIDFIHKNGALSVPGAIEDTKRTIKFMLNNFKRLTSIAASLDTHVPIQIFSPGYWRDRKTGEMPDPFTQIDKAVFNTRYTPVFVPPWDTSWNGKYIDTLSNTDKKALLLWTFHELLGTPGHAIEPSLFEVILAWSIARQTNPEFLMKGTNLFTEHYSILEPEVKIPGDPTAALDANFLQMLEAYDKIYIAGQAKSHCVFETIRSIVRHFSTHATYMLPRINLLMDCMSSVQHPQIDFEAMVMPTYKSWEKSGLRLTTSDDIV